MSEFEADIRDSRFRTGFNSAGESEDEALDSAREAILGHLELLAAGAALN